jgi:hypothetical protein
VDQETNYKKQQVEFLLEEPSMANALKIILPQILPKGFELGINCFLRPHQGKQDLKKSIPKKIKTFSKFYIPSKIIIVHDQDSNDCKILKSELAKLCGDNGNCPVLIRIACRELENWYLGDMAAINKIYSDFKPKNHRYKSKFRTVDNTHGSDELESLIPTFQKGYASRNIPYHMNIANNRSISFNHFIVGVMKFLK